MNSIAKHFSFISALLLCAFLATHPSHSNAQATSPGVAPPSNFATPGYPRPFSFREINPKFLPHMDWMTMAVSDMHIRSRQDAESEYKIRYPDRPLLVQINIEGQMLWGTWICLPKQRLMDVGILSKKSLDVFKEFTTGIYPMIDFPGHWAYEAGAHSTAPIPANQETITVPVTDMLPFEPNTNAFNKKHNQPAGFMKDIVICPRDKQGALDWLNARFASITAIDKEASTVTLRRWNVPNQNGAEDWTAFEAGAYLAPNANQIVLDGFPPIWQKFLGVSDEKHYTPFLPNLSPLCPPDPRTGLTAAQWLARHYINVKRKTYPTADGYVLDVSASTFHPSERISHRADADVDGQVDSFYKDNLDTWALGMHDYFSYLRDGVPGKFEGLGPSLVIATDSNSNEEARFFDLINGAEYEHATYIPHSRHSLSGNIDRYLLWSNISRQPRLSYIHHKYPTDTYHGGTDDDLAFYMHDHYYRLDIAVACMGTGYVGYNMSRPGGRPATINPKRKEQKEKYGVVLPLDWDEYHNGDQNERFWLGQPIGPAVRITPTQSDYHWQADAKTLAGAEMIVQELYQSRINKTTSNSITVEVLKTQPWNRTGFKARIVLKIPSLKYDTEYTLTFDASSPSPYAKAGAQYAAIPRNLEARLVVDKNYGKPQEVLVFAKQRQISITLTTPSLPKNTDPNATFSAKLEFGIAEEPGPLTLSNITLQQGSADILYRPFEHGLVLLNGSVNSPYTFNLAKLLPGQSFRRIKGTQDPVHNSGKPVNKTLTLNPLDGILLKRIEPGESLRPLRRKD